MCAAGALLRRARDRERGLGPRCRGLGRARRRARRARDEGLAAGEQLRRRRRAASRPRSARTTRPSSTPRTSSARSHETADLRLVEVLTGEAPSAIHWLEELGVEFTREQRRLPPRPLRRRDCASACCRSATAPATRSRRRCARPGRPATGTSFTNAPLRELAPRRTATGARACGDRRRRGGHRRARRRRPLLRRGRAARRAVDEPPERDRRGDADRPRPRAPRRATSTRSSTTRTAAPGRRTCRATRSPRRRAPTARCS